MPAVVTAPQGASVLAYVPDGWYTVSRAAAMVGRSADTLVRWRKGRPGSDPIFEPSGYMEVGETHMKVYLYSEEDIEAMRQIVKTMKTGPKSAA